MGAETLYRLTLALVLAANLTVSAAFRRAARRSETIERRREGAALISARLLLALPALALIVTFLFWPERLAATRLPLPDALRAAGIPLALATVPLAVWILRSIGPNVSETVLTKRSHQLVTDGAYSRVRHPLYANGLLMCFSFALLSADASILGLTLVAAVAFRCGIVPREEAELEARFGDAYRRYRQRTGALLPRLGAPPGGDSAGAGGLP